MLLAILSRNKSLHSTRRLIKEAKKHRIRCEVIDPLDCQVVVDGERSCVMAGGRTLPHYDAVLPRIGASITDYGLAVVRQFETLGTYTVNSSRAIAESRDKMRSLQVLTQAGLKVPVTALNRSPRNLRTAVARVGGLPVVLKVLKGTQGVGVMLLNAPVSLLSVLDTLRGLEQDVILQQFIAEGAGRDYRAFVVGNRVVAAMMRTAPEGEFRSNIHRGGQGRLIKLPRPYVEAAIRAARTLGLGVAGVDLMESESGPMIIEVNSSPGFEGIERATGLNIAGAILSYIRSEARKRGPQGGKRRAPPKRRTRRSKKRR
jgi:ribosomal protein S6--L-glutamate ligase